MLTKYDDYLCHQIYDGFDTVFTTERNWSEHIFAAFYDYGSKLHVGFRFGKYPNRNVMDAGVAVAMGAKQITVRASRELWPNVDIEKVGPIEYHVVEPLKKVRIVLGDNDYGASFDVELESSVFPKAEPSGHTVIKGVTFNRENRVYVTIRATGKVTFKGKTYDIKKDTAYGLRDHTWGLRGYTGVPPEGNPLWRKGQANPESGMMPISMPDGLLGCLIILQTKDYSIFYTHIEDPEAKTQQSAMVAGARGYLLYPLGDSRPPVMLVDSHFDWELFPGTRVLKQFKGELIQEDGKRIQISSKYKGSRFSLDAQGYHGGYKGWWIGKWHGPYAIDSEELDLADEGTLRKVGSLMDVALEFNVDGKLGYGSIEGSAFGRLPKYGLEASDIPWE